MIQQVLMTPTTYIKYREDDTNRYGTCLSLFHFCLLLSAYLYIKNRFLHIRFPSTLSFFLHVQCKYYILKTYKLQRRWNGIRIKNSTHWSKDSVFHPHSSRFALSVFKDLKSVFHSVFVPTFFVFTSKKR